ncbi:hypothetical protein [Hydrogenimonas sp.]|uniref:hypothetical protein n=1 Tax=Hydrogenimonas sp. TaxID=2231112 RepID=UPI00261657FA|nr:hypothetical protein [Hydrogenimonas sp.]
MTTEVERLESVQTNEVDAAKREFMKKFGKYAATAPLGMYVLMSPVASRAQASGSCASCDISGEDIQWNQTFEYHNNKNPQWDVTPLKVGEDWALQVDHKDPGQAAFTFYYNGNGYQYDGATKYYFKFNEITSTFDPNNVQAAYGTYEEMVLAEGGCDETLGMLLDCISDFLYN